MNGTIKKLGGYPCCHRQWKATSHCRFLHGYDRFVTLEWQGPRDELGWVIDFGGLKYIKNVLEYQYDHTTLIAEDDPEMLLFEELAEKGAIDLRVGDPTMEGMTHFVASLVEGWTEENVPAAKLIRVECWENEKNGATLCL